MVLCYCGFFSYSDQSSTRNITAHAFLVWTFILFTRGFANGFDLFLPSSSSSAATGGGGGTPWITPSCVAVPLSRFHLLTSSTCAKSYKKFRAANKSRTDDNNSSSSQVAGDVDVKVTGYSVFEGDSDLAILTLELERGENSEEEDVIREVAELHYFDEEEIFNGESDKRLGNVSTIYLDQDGFVKCGDNDDLIPTNYGGKTLNAISGAPIIYNYRGGTGYSQMQKEALVGFVTEVKAVIFTKKQIKFLQTQISLDNARLVETLLPARRHHLFRCEKLDQIVISYAMKTIARGEKEDCWRRRRRRCRCRHRCKAKTSTPLNDEPNSTTSPPPEEVLLSLLTEKLEAKEREIEHLQELLRRRDDREYHIAAGSMVANIRN